MKLLLLGSLVSVAACGGDPAPVAEVVGTWRQLPDSNDVTIPEDQRVVFVFVDDGTFTRTDGAQVPLAGTYELADGRITLTAGGPPSEVAYYVDDTRFLYGTLAPDDDGADAVATWAGYAVSSTGRLDTTMVLRADTTAHLEQVDDEGTTALDGTWVQTDDDVEATFDLGEGSSITTSASLHAGFLGTAFEAI